MGYFYIKEILFSFLLLATSVVFADISPEKVNIVLSIAASGLENNIHTFKTGKHLSAGAHQFKSLWTRDFCYSVRGLLKLGRADVVRDHLTLLLSNKREKDDLVPKVMDTINSNIRVFMAVFNVTLPFKGKLRPEYFDGEKTIDSNVLTVMAALDYVDTTGDLGWWHDNEAALVSVYHYYDRFFKDGLIVQAKYSDWQDSVKRKGAVFLTNLLYYTVSARLLENPAFEIDRDKLQKYRDRIEETFYDPSTGLYFAWAGQSYISLDGLLFAIDLDYLDNARAYQLYESLKQHELWTKYELPGFATYPSYTRKMLHWRVKVVGLEEYHGNIYWSWLMAFSGKIAYKMGDTESVGKIFNNLSAMIERDGTVGEIYFPKASFPLWEDGINADKPFSWGSAFVVDFVKTISSEYF